MTMRNPIISLGRAISLRKHRSQRESRLTPLPKIHSVMLLLDANDSSAGKCALAAKKYFTATGLECKVYAFSGEKEHVSVEGAILLAKRNFNWFGRPKRSRRSPAVDFEADLFIDLTASGIYAAEYCARCCKAAFKVSRKQTNDSIFNLVMESDGYSAAEVLENLIPLLESVK